MKRFVLAITGASGAIFGIKVLEELLKTAEVYLTISSNAFPIIKDETGLDWGKNTEKSVREHFGVAHLFYFSNDDFNAPFASGSFRTDGMLVVPCSMKTLAGVANGYANNLIERAADVTIKEGRPLLLSPREMPFSAIHLENMLKLSRLGVTIAPPVPGFYHKPKNIDEIVNFIAGKILDSFRVDNTLFKRWNS